MKQSLAERAEDLRKQLEHHEYQYYVLDAPEISDAEVRLPHARIARTGERSS